MQFKYVHIFPSCLIQGGELVFKKMCNAQLILVKYIKMRVRFFATFESPLAKLFWGIPMYSDVQGYTPESQGF